MGDETAVPVPHARLKLGLMFLLPGLAVLLATLVYYSGIGLPRGTTNKGVLLLPPRQIDELALTSAAGETWRYDGARRGWGMLVAGGASCDGACRERITLMRQLRKALGDDAARVHRYYLAADSIPDSGFAAWLGAEQADLQVLNTREAALRALLERDGDPDPLRSDAMYLVDPRGFVMMYYLPVHPGRATLDDLRFLLRNSAD